jgi:DNA-binding NarL/FixJ family response regulator
MDFFQSKLPKPSVFLNKYALTKKLKVIALTENTDLNQIEELFSGGVMGYISKAASFNDLLEGIEKVGNGHQFLSHGINQPLKSQAPPHLTPQEKRVLTLLTKGYSAKEIAEFLKIAVKTVYIHRSRIIQKLGTKNLIHLRNKALKLGIELPYPNQAAQSG